MQNIQCRGDNISFDYEIKTFNGFHLFELNTEQNCGKKLASALAERFARPTIQPEGFERAELFHRTYVLESGILVPTEYLGLTQEPVPRKRRVSKKYDLRKLDSLPEEVTTKHMSDLGYSIGGANRVFDRLGVEKLGPGKSRTATKQQILEFFRDR